MAIEPEEIARRFGYHRPDSEQQEQIEAFREQFANLAMRIVERTPVSREQSLAITALEEASFWTIGSIARNSPLVVDPLV